LEYLLEYGLFLAKAVTLVVAVLVVVVTMVALGQRQRVRQEGHLEVHDLNERYRQLSRQIDQVVDDRDTLKKKLKLEKKEAKEKKKPQEGGAPRRRLFLLNFHGDIKAGNCDNLREEISAVLSRARSEDQVLVRLESAGGMVHAYGLAAGQLARITDAGIPLTVAVDKVAASGGYMMACVADRILAAPFAVLGSIGVLAQLPNFHRLLKENNIDFEQLYAGEYKRTLSLFGENTEKGREKFQQELEETHQLFKDFVRRHRDQVDVDAVATGEIWYGQQALDIGLVDAIGTSDAYIQESLADSDIFEVRYVQKKSWQEKLGLAAESTAERLVMRLWQQSLQRPGA